VSEISQAKRLATQQAKQLVPVASNVKLVTAAAALSVLGPEFRIETGVYSTSRNASVIGGDIYLKGYGDPSLTVEQLRLLVDKLYDAGVRKITGGVIIDESYFDTKRLAPLYETRDTDKYYRPASGALSIERNAVAVRVYGAERAGKLARIVVRPASSYFRVSNRVMTVKGKRRSWAKLDTEGKGGRTHLNVRGRVRPHYHGRWFYRRISHPGLLTGATFVDILRKRGIKVGKRKIRRGKTPDKAWSVVSHRSPPLAELVRQMNKSSNNFTAEQLLKIMGAVKHKTPGTWDKGLKVVAEYLSKLGIKKTSYAMKNGSGLYEGNKFTARQLVTILRAVYRDFRISGDYVSSLPIAGVEGTLRRRMRKGPARRYIRAKTGTLNQVVSLSGYASAPNRKEPLAFSILLSELPDGKIRRARALADKMATTIVNFAARK
jgi:serine-type D-Ala-D-Ala carboxypeptidase/endopeptidase (penicillin-binding protein 4)